jgi:F-type H+-transporting ATPase subunit a
MIARKSINFLVLLCYLSLPVSGLASDPKKQGDGGENDFNPAELAMEHVLDAHEWHLADYNGHSYSIPLPVILWDDGLKVFMSSEFEHGEAVVEKGGDHYVIHHETIYRSDASGTLNMDAEGHPTNETPLDFSITKNVASMFISVLLLLLIFIAAARSYKKSEVPKGIAAFVEPIIVFVRDDIARNNIGEKHYRKFLPYLLTVFFFIWINNLFGLLPIPPGGGANVTGNIAVTMVLAIFTFILTNVYGNKDYWKHIFWMPGVPVAVKPLLAVVEFLGIFTKPFALMIRLFANITAGHIIILSLISLIFIFETEWASVASIPFVLFMSCIELLVALLQAYIFTLLSALFIGLAVQEHAHGHEEAH